MIYDNFKLMLDSMANHLKSNPGSKIKNKDNPMQLLIGFIDPVTNDTWQIGIAKYKKLESEDQALAEFIRPYIADSILRDKLPEDYLSSIS